MTAMPPVKVEAGERGHVPGERKSGEPRDDDGGTSSSSAIGAHAVQRRAGAQAMALIHPGEHKADGDHRERSVHASAAKPGSETG